MYKSYLVPLAALLSILAYTPPTGKTFTITHFNILFAPDMSNRVDPKLYKRPLNDVDILSIITNNLYPSILRFKRMENQKDRLMIDFINKGLIKQYQVNTEKLLINFGKFPTQRERIEYIFAKPGIKPSMEKDINEMTGEYSLVNNQAIKDNVGADIWSYLNQGIDENKILTNESIVKYKNDIYTNTYRNILILPTDGYIEAGIFGKGFDCSKNTINNFRKAFYTSGEKDMQEFLRKNKRFQIKPVNNELLKNLEILVMELYDRSLSKAGCATVHPTDMEIIKLLWTDWLQQSNVKRFELHPYASSKAEAEIIILKFIGIPTIKSL
ncbi:hypothetical protein [Chitinophaga sancti]|uniref:Uncharacterized protein n=1 Tax=Chitinophaga sancti TaxID=1004 RepID=A0A1K1PK55_9BACT|nr:hypothetical protein [Chitinophaga sancti]WQD59489.1 hypothetical protein U0033_16475 [Chitinophaga sancti]WQG88376.1 hypothetical protein SR876_25990 [Chitinophaga sancti]SFW48170.1 hypothetical protein SAMN05661012_02067 [Chitinophaga sancti]